MSLKLCIAPRLPPVWSHRLLVHKDQWPAGHTQQRSRVPHARQQGVRRLHYQHHRKRVALRQRCVVLRGGDQAPAVPFTVTAMNVRTASSRAQILTCALPAHATHARHSFRLASWTASATCACGLACTSRRPCPTPSGRTAHAPTRTRSPSRCPCSCRRPATPCIAGPATATGSQSGAGPPCPASFVRSAELTPEDPINTCT